MLTKSLNQGNCNTEQAAGDSLAEALIMLNSEQGGSQYLLNRPAFENFNKHTSQYYLPIMEVSIRTAKRGYIRAKKDKESHIQLAHRCPSNFEPDSHSRYGNQQE
jgi:hypothetical protein